MKKSMAIIMALAMACFFFHGLLAFAQKKETLEIKFLHSTVDVEAEGRIYKLGYIAELDPNTLKQQRNILHLIVMDSEGKFVSDPGILEKVYFAEYVYRPSFFRPNDLPIGPSEIGRHKEMDAYRFTQQMTDAVLFIREAAVRSLVQDSKNQ